VRFEVEIDRRVREVILQRAHGCFLATVDGRERRVNAVRVDAHTWSLLVEHESGRSAYSYEVSIIPEPAADRFAVHVGPVPVTVSLDGRRRWGRKAHDGQPTPGGPQRVVASMSGKVVRVLVQTGEAVHARQPVVVIEAMKMENELRATHDGTVAEITVRDGQSVDAGALLVVIV
jgi:biotin carboxyl carrier protein